MNPLKLFLAVLLFSCVIYADDKSVLNAEKMKSVRLIFVSGNNESAQKARDEIGKGKSCLSLAHSRQEAEAVLDVNADRSQFPLINVSGTLTSQDGTLMWARTRGAGTALVSDIRKAACK